VLPRCARFFAVLGVFLFFITKTSLASEELEALPLSHYIMAIVYDDLGDIDSAIKEYRKALKADNPPALIHLNLAASLIKNNQLDKAQEELKLAIKLDPNAAEPHAVLAILYLIQDKIDLAALEYETALQNASQLNPQDTDVYKSLGFLYLKQNKLIKAQSAFKLAASLTPTDPEAHFYLGCVYNYLNERVLCEKELKLTLELSPDYAPALNFLGYYYVEKNQNLREAGKMIRRAVSLEPENGAYVDSLGWFYFKSGRIKEAKQALEKAVLLMPDPVIYEHLGDVNYKLKNFPEARLNWQKALDFKKEDQSIKNKLEKLNKNVGSAK
jgi:Tfp pilus assembly protein PilF